MWDTFRHTSKTLAGNKLHDDTIKELVLLLSSLFFNWQMVFATRYAMYSFEYLCWIAGTTTTNYYSDQNSYQVALNFKVEYLCTIVGAF